VADRYRLGQFRVPWIVSQSGRGVVSTPWAFGAHGAYGVCRDVAVQQNPARWAELIQKSTEKDKALYSKEVTASIVLYCSRCKRKTKCDYYQIRRDRQTSP
jgi:hypothetical protein